MDVTERLLNVALLISPFFFWGTSMVVMKVNGHFHFHFRDVISGLLACGAAYDAFVCGICSIVPSWIGVACLGELQRSTSTQFFDGLVEHCFVRDHRWRLFPSTHFISQNKILNQGFLAEGLRRTTAGLGSIIIDSQPLTVAVLASLFYKEKFTPASAAGLGFNFHQFDIFLEAFRFGNRWFEFFAA